MPESDAAHLEEDTPAGGRESRLAFLSHPLFVGAAVAIIGAVFASLLIPSITQVTQDRPRELELKQTVVERIAESTAAALNKGVALAKKDLEAAGGGDDTLTAYRRVYGDWLVAESTVDGQITTYFSEGGSKARAAWQEWRTLRTSVTYFLQLSSVRELKVRKRARNYLRHHLRPYMGGRTELRIFNDTFDDPDVLLNQANAKNKFRALAELLELERDAVTVKIVDAPAAGFRHSPWSLG